MPSKKKSRVRAHMAKTGLTYEGALHNLRASEGPVDPKPVLVALRGDDAVASLRDMLTKPDFLWAAKKRPDIAEKLKNLRDRPEFRDVIDQFLVDLDAFDTTALDAEADRGVIEQDQMQVEAAPEPEDDPILSTLFRQDAAAFRSNMGKQAVFAPDTVPQPGFDMTRCETKVQMEDLAAQYRSDGWVVLPHDDVWAGVLGYMIVMEKDGSKTPVLLEWRPFGDVVPAVTFITPYQHYSTYHQRQSHDPAQFQLDLRTTLQMLQGKTLYRASDPVNRIAGVVHYSSGVAHIVRVPLTSLVGCPEAQSFGHLVLHAKNLREELLG